MILGVSIRRDRHDGTAFWNFVDEPWAALREEIVISFKYEWEREYVAAILETGDERLAARILAAGLAIANRMDELNVSDGGTQEEQQSITAALASLEKLRIEWLGRSR